MQSEERTCPCCGQSVTSMPEVSVSLSENRLFFNERSIDLTSRLAELAFILAARMPETVPTDAIIARMWGSMEGDFARSNVGVGIMQLRRALQPLGLRIMNTHGIGFKLEAAPPLSRTERNSSQEEARAQA